jgi:GDP-4-dehydro-6-deoxy-D-mannose reductase
VGRHLTAQLGERAVGAQVDVLDAVAVAACLSETAPAAIVHLAAQSSVADSWRDVRGAWEVNVIGTVNLLEAARRETPGARVLFVSTGEVYGAAESFPTPETEPIRPISPYAATKAAAEIACRQFAAGGLDVVVARAFNNEGPGRDERFAVGSWARQIAELENGGAGTLEVGDLSTRRDLTDVRDACRAYSLLLDAEAAGTYNVASGRSVAMSEVLELMISLAQAPVDVEQRPERVRPHEITRLEGDPSRLQQATGWKPEIPLEQTLADTLAEARKRLAAEGAAR